MIKQRVISVEIKVKFSDLIHHVSANANEGLIIHDGVKNLMKYRRECVATPRITHFKRRRVFGVKPSRYKTSGGLMDVFSSGCSDNSLKCPKSCCYI